MPAWRGPIPALPQLEAELNVAPLWGQFPFVSLTDVTAQIRCAVLGLTGFAINHSAFSSPSGQKRLSFGALLSTISSPAPIFSFQVGLN